MILFLGGIKGGDILDIILDSILNTVKKLLGIDVDDTSFDDDVIILINSSMLSLSQMGIGPANGFIVTSSIDKWTDYISDNTINLEGVKTYLYLKVKLTFDPPTNSTVIEAMKKTLEELEWRMMLSVESKN